jgi:hypothetical protein
MITGYTIAGSIFEDVAAAADVEAGAAVALV